MYIIPDLTKLKIMAKEGGHPEDEGDAVVRPMAGIG